MNPELKAAIERLRREVANHMLGMEGETDAFSADILAVCTALEQAMRVVEAAKKFRDLDDKMHKMPNENRRAYFDEQENNLDAVCEALAAMEEQ